MSVLPFNRAPLPSELAIYHQHLYASKIAQGKVRPFVVPYHFYGLTLLIAYLSIPHTNRPWLYAARWPVLAAIVIFEVKAAFQTSSIGAAASYIAGLVSGYAIMLSISWLVWYRPQFDAKRIEKRKINVAEKENMAKSTSNGLATAVYSNGNGSLKQRPTTNGHTNGHASGRREDTNRHDESEYVWQPYPDNFRDRLVWAIDLVCNQRGERWNWAIPTLPPLPVRVKRSLGEPISQKEETQNQTAGIRSSIGNVSFPSWKALVRSHVPKIVVGYFVLDLIKTALINDPYFLVGPNSFDLPPHLDRLHWLLLRLYRQSLVFTAITLALEVAFMFQALFMGSLALLPGVSSYLGVRPEVWMYPSQWGSFSQISNKGLNGLWGGWWHQTFRFVFAAPTNYLISNKIIEPRSMAAKFCALFFAFSISGILHACGSMTQLGDTNPWHPFIFFMLQGLGVFLQTVLCTSLRPLISKLPSSVRKTGNVLFTFGWLCLTANWLVDDMARGGLFTFEPIPLSPSRGLGFGPEEPRWFCMNKVDLIWYKGKHWWESGIAERI
ncbi:hypothetical protein BP6252_10382 [Coleophoma cylindrospora]|uniref:Wax synthase domain-containing protein n=1 Tax=Coleophoma cylindrospora TaxID=1849047 RepID=A0A3D8QSQ5_9HELO|nr:hypothetical protein BP6252_10382 [Coleophoma cylindrospora]